MASPNTTWDDLATTTIDERTKELADNVTQSHGLLLSMQEKGNTKMVSGGENILQELEYAESTNFTWLDGAEQIPVEAQNLFSAASYLPKICACAIVITLKEQLINQGPERMIDLLEARIKNSENTMKNQVGDALYGDGSLFGGKIIGGLQQYVPDDPTTGTVGGISRATWTFWRSKVTDFTSDISAGGSSSSNFVRGLNALHVKLVRGREKHNIGFADNNYWVKYLESLQPMQRTEDTKMADAGFENIKYMGSPIILDGGEGGGCPTNHLYLLNTKYMFWRPYTGLNMERIEGDRIPVNQLALVKVVGFMGNLTMSNSARQGVLKE